MDELRPCPFCGGKADIHYAYTWGLQNQYEVRCDLCPCAMGVHGSEQEAIEEWNRRADQDG